MARVAGLQEARILANEFAGAITSEAGKSVVHVFDLSVQGSNQHCCRTLIHRGGQGEKLFLSTLALGQIVDDTGEEVAPVQAHLADGQIQRENRAVLALTGYFPPDADDLLDARPEVSSEVAVVSLPVRRGHQRL